MPKYKIKHTSIMHNGNLCKEGDIVEFTEKQAKRLEDFVILIPEKKQTPPSTDNKQKNQTSNKGKGKTETKTETQTEVKKGGTNDK